MANLFDYRSGESLTHRLNPLTKLVVGAALVVAVFLLPSFWGPALIALALVGIAASAGVFRPLAAITVGIATPLALALLIIHGLFYPGNETPLFSVGPVTVWKEGVLYALLVSFRLLVLAIAVLLIVFTTHPKKMMIVLTDRGLSPKLAYVFLAALQFVPEMQERAQAILEAQQARGLDIKASLWRRFRALIAMMVPLLTGALISAETRSQALEARGFSREGQRTHLLEVADTGTDRAVRWAAIGVVAAMVAWRIAA